MQLTFGDAEEDATQRVLNALKDLVVRVTTPARREDMEVLKCERRHDNLILFGRLVDEEGNPKPRGDYGVPVRLIEELHVY